MDTLRGNFDSPAYDDDDRGDYYADDEASREPPPAAIGSDERRMQVRAYNHWASLLDERNFPSIEDLDPGALPDFGPYSVLLDFTSGIENPAVPFLGAELAVECGADGEIESLADVPARSLLSRITDHYLQILANQAPIGFEAEFVNQRGATILYRRVLPGVVAERGSRIVCRGLIAAGDRQRDHLARVAGRTVGPVGDGIGRASGFFLGVAGLERLVAQLLALQPHSPTITDSDL